MELCSQNRRTDLALLNLKKNFNLTDNLQDVARHPTISKDLLPFPTEYKVQISPASSSPSSTINTTTTRLTTKLNTLLTSLSLDWTWSPLTLSGLCSATENVWSRAARRKLKREDLPGKTKASSAKEISKRETRADADSDSDDASSEEEPDPALVVRITLQPATGDGEGSDNGEGEGLGAVEAVMVQWVRGMDSVLFESFCGMLKREMTGPYGEEAGNGR